MDTDLVQALEQLETKKNTVNAEADLSKECESVVELDRRIGLLLNEIKSLRVSIEEESGFVGGICNQLAGSFKTLDQTTEIHDVIVRLIRLNKLCKRINRSPIFRISNPTSLHTPAPQQPQQSSATSTVELPNDNENNTDMANQSRLELIELFETTYAPLETILNQRPDLPYVTYANLVRTMKLSLRS